MDKLRVLQDLAGKLGTPLIVVDHEVLRRNHREFLLVLRLKVPNTGAYGCATATHFNGFSQVKVVHINR